jgi:hypothetical protein
MPNWAARIDLIHESATGRLYFLECDVAPLVGAKSAFAASFSAAGVGRLEQLRWLLTKQAQDGLGPEVTETTTWPENIEGWMPPGAPMCRSTSTPANLISVCPGASLSAIAHIGCIEF